MQADIVIMTTEILRNVMYKVGELDGVALDQSAEDRLADVALIVLDEVSWQLASALSGSTPDADRLTGVALTLHEVTIPWAWLAPVFVKGILDVGSLG